MAMKEATLKIQKDKNLTDKKMGASLGVSREYWNGVKKGKRPFTPKLQHKAISVYPELIPIFLSENITKSNKSK